jgi:hypothetical protein
MAEFAGFSAGTFRFLAELGEGRDKEWFHANKARFQEVLVEPLKALVEEVGPSLLAMDPHFEVQPKTNRTLTRINRDMRFNPDRPPYKDHMLALFYREGRKRQDAQLFLGLQPSGAWSGLYVGGHLLGDEAPAAAGGVSLADLGRRCGVGRDYELCVCERYGEIHRILDGQRDEDYRTGPHLVVLQRRSPSEVEKLGPELTDDLAETFRRLYPLWLRYSGEAA